jgi:hypothetical protein
MTIGDVRHQGSSVAYRLAGGQIIEGRITTKPAWFLHRHTGK